MTTKVSNPSRRFSREQQQENRSRRQFAERLDEIGWIPSSLETDMGEDLYVRIYDGGQSTGLSFYVQLKSTADSAKLTRKRAPALSYELEVKDLLHWEVSTTLVVLVLWDVDKRAGWWRPVLEIIEELDTNKKGWREQEGVTVSIPLANTTDDPGLRALRWRVADHNIPLAPKPREMSFSLTFEKTAEGTAALQALERALDAGDKVTFENGYIPKIEYPPWLTRLYGKERFEHIVKMELKPTPSTHHKTINIEIDSPEGPAAISCVELRPVKRGRKRLLLSNEHQSMPIVFTFDLSEEHLKLNFRQKRLGHTAYEAREAAAFMLASAVRKSTIRIVDPRSGREIASFQSGHAVTNYDVAEMQHRRDIFDKLYFIQQQLARRGVAPFSLADIDQIDGEEVAAIHQLFQVCRDGKREDTKTIAFKVTPTANEVPDYEGNVQFCFSGARLRLLNREIPLGDMTSTISDSARLLEATRSARAEAVATGRPVRVVLEKMHVIEEYHDWLQHTLSWDALSDAFDRLAKVSSPREGYFTRAEARAAGASDPIFDVLLREHKIEPSATDVFRLAHFPPSDHEELIVLWLQTERRGVLSHETALFLHELSDILPGRRHITVLPGWTPEGSAIGNNIDIHWANVDEDEIRWCGPVPYTAPLRTLRDCIAVGVSPDLIEQAIEEGLQRGLFRKDQLPPIIQAESS